MNMSLLLDSIIRENQQRRGQIEYLRKMWIEKYIKNILKSKNKTKIKLSP
jgi:hypothetical protein